MDVVEVKGLGRHKQGRLKDGPAYPLRTSRTHYAEHRRTRSRNSDTPAFSLPSHDSRRCDTSAMRPPVTAEAAACQLLPSPSLLSIYCASVPFDVSCSLSFRRTFTCLGTASYNGTSLAPDEPAESRLYGGWSCETQSRHSTLFNLEWISAIPAMGCHDFWEVDSNPTNVWQLGFCSCGSPNIRSLFSNGVGRCTLFMYSNDSSYCVLLDRRLVSASNSICCV
ncbi:hypothetical protein NEOLEDRAFT_1133627 [Neolentinus lepideus HHB14362 ss-1]|uniref:Uncharacterized protein n=1 Tax=Neolentinus lepideus HHB14362 ss-1 TaxID=1314782 RepID=A0A165SSK3_9AGAM|nr:hypothetical protein NEOLEDRAFT_1133627 [Neolentinus lepideus HHB14362 ss-1]